MKYFLFILLPVFIYAQDSTSQQALHRRTQELLNKLNSVKVSVDSMKARNKYLEDVLFGKTVLSWSGGDPDGDPVTYDVYFGTDSIAPPYVATVHDTLYQPGRLNWDTTYYWYIVAKDDKGLTSTGSLWHFSTMPVPK